MGGNDQLNQLNRRFHAHLKGAVDAATYRLWLAPVAVSAVQGQTARLTAPTGSADWVASRFGRLLADAVHRASDGELAGAVFVSPAADDREQGPSEATIGIQPSPVSTFANFAVGHTNQLAHNAALTVSEVPACSFNPLVVWGPEGCGKTHLLHAAATAIASHHSGLQVMLTTGERFASAFLAALRSRQLEPFKRVVRSLDGLLLDDLDFICGKERTEEELLHTLTAVLARGGQVVAASKLPPAQLPLRNPALRELLGSGLIVDIQPPDRRLAVAVLQRRLADHGGIEVEEEVVELLANRFPANIRLLSAALMRLIAYCSLRGEPLTVAVGERVLAALYPARERPTRPTVDAVKAAVAKRFGVAVRELEGKNRDLALTAARGVAIYLARELTGSSLPALGREFGGRDHTTVLAAIRSFKRRLQTDPQLAHSVQEITAELGKAHNLSPSPYTSSCGSQTAAPTADPSASPQGWPPTNYSDL